MGNKSWTVKWRRSISHQHEATISLLLADQVFGILIALHYCEWQNRTKCNFVIWFFRPFNVLRIPGYHWHIPLWRHDGLWHYFTLLCLVVGDLNWSHYIYDWKSSKYKDDHTLLKSSSKIVMLLIGGSSIKIAYYGFHLWMDDVRIIHAEDLRKACEWMQLFCRWIKSIGYPKNLPLIKHVANWYQMAHTRCNLVESLNMLLCHD